MRTVEVLGQPYLLDCCCVSVLLPFCRTIGVSLPLLRLCLLPYSYVCLYIYILVMHVFNIYLCFRALASLFLIYMCIFTIFSLFYILYIMYSIAAAL